MSSELVENTRPHDLKAEQSVLGALLKEPDYVWGKIGDVLSKDDFYFERHQWIWEVATGLLEVGKSVDYITILDELEKKELLKEMGGALTLTDIVNANPTSFHVADHAAIVKRLSRLRHIIAIAGEAAELAWKPDADPGQIETVMLTTLAQKSSGGLEMYTVDEALAIAEERQRRIAAGEDLGGLDPLLPTLRNSLPHGVWRKGMIVLIGGDTGLGKSWLAFQIAAVNALLGRRMAYIGNELPIDFLAERLALTLGNIIPTLPERVQERIAKRVHIPIDNNMLLAGKAADYIAVLRPEMARLMEDRQLLLIPSGTEINKIIRSLQMESLRAGPFDGVALDYIQLIEDELERSYSETAQQSAVIKKIVQWCIDTETNLVCVSALRKHTNTVPTKDDIYGASRFSYSTSCSYALWRDDTVPMRDPLNESKDKGLRLRALKSSREKGYVDMENKDICVYITPDNGIFGETPIDQIIPTTSY